MASALDKPDLPEPKPPTAMPDPKAQERAMRRSLSEQMQRRGRASTILTQSETLGG